MFNFKKTYNIKFISSDLAEGLPQPYPSYKHFPEWFVKSNTRSKCPFAPLMKLRSLNPKASLDTSKSPYTITKVTTVKHCPGIVDYLKTGYVLPAWSDMILRQINSEMVYESAVSTPEMHYGLHRPNQYEGMSYDQRPEMGMFHKVSSPWYIKTDPGVSVLITDPYWERNKNFTSVSAIVHPDVTPIHLKWFFELNKPIKDTAEIYDENIQIIKKDTPLLLVIPFKREKFDYSCEYLDFQQMSKLHKENLYGSITWFSESLYERFRRTLGNLYK
jgi:hypothetical protein